MSNLIVIAFENHVDAFAMREALFKLQAQYLIDMEDAVVVTSSAIGQVHLHQTVNLTAAGAASGAFWGGLIGMLFLNPLVGAGMGAAAGALSGKFTDIGIDDQFVKEIGRTVGFNGSALCILVRKSTPDKVLEALRPFVGKGRVLQTSLNKEKEDQLRQAIERREADASVPAAT